MNLFSFLELDTIADALVDCGYIVMDIHHPMVKTLATHIMELNSFTPASLGRTDSKYINANIRSDETSWLNETIDVDTLYLNGMRTLQEGMNERLFMGLHYHEAHYSHYKPESLYQKHLDAFIGRSGRKLTTVFYLNEDWNSADGGSLLLYDGEDKLIETIVPVLGRMVIFLSEKFPHEVLASHRDRYSIAGWFRID